MSATANAWSTKDVANRPRSRNKKMRDMLLPMTPSIGWAVVGSVTAFYLAYSCKVFLPESINNLLSNFMFLITCGQISYRKLWPVRSVVYRLLFRSILMTKYETLLSNVVFNYFGRKSRQELWLENCTVNWVIKVETLIFSPFPYKNSPWNVPSVSPTPWDVMPMVSHRNPRDLVGTLLNPMGYYGIS